MSHQLQCLKAFTPEELLQLRSQYNYNINFKQKYVFVLNQISRQSTSEYSSSGWHQFLTSTAMKSFSDKLHKLFRSTVFYLFLNEIAFLISGFGDNEFYERVFWTGCYLRAHGFKARIGVAQYFDLK
ncbi:Hypothetical_protein [Hexamita inflata]|uniref:Hypothetical_protein n=1 Tax=Hexamita inflata TaxID=28002 RepID=A0AA86RUN4_9EUKA|nr:Hypothetical protein HINF_LOCUS65977 [Hexamita inflata]